jgi:hypothetical protein
MRCDAVFPRLVTKISSVVCMILQGLVLCLCVATMHSFWQVSCLIESVMSLQCHKAKNFVPGKEAQSTKVMITQDLQFSTVHKHSV